MSPLRWQMIALCFLANIINFLDRSNLAIAVPRIEAELHLSSFQMGLALSAFFWTYALMQLPVGWMIDRFGVRRCLAGSVLWWSFFTAVTAFVSDLPSLLGARLLLGVGEAGALPGFAKVVFNWFPRTERGFASSIFDSGSRVGSALALPLVACSSPLLAGVIPSSGQELSASSGWRSGSAFIVTRKTILVSETRSVAC